MLRECRLTQLRGCWCSRSARYSRLLCTNSHAVAISLHSLTILVITQVCQIFCNASNTVQSGIQIKCPIQYGLRLWEAVSKKQSDEGYLYTVDYSTLSHSKKVNKGQTLPPDLGASIELTQIEASRLVDAVITAM